MYMIRKEKTMEKAIFKKISAFLIIMIMAATYVTTALAASDLDWKSYSATTMKIGFTSTRYIYKSSTAVWETIEEQNYGITCTNMTSGIYQISYPRTASGTKIADRRQIDSGETDTHNIYCGIGSNPDYSTTNENVHLRIEKPSGYSSTANMTTSGRFMGLTDPMEV